MARPQHPPTDRRAPAAVDLTDDLAFAAYLLDSTRAAWLAGRIPNADRAAVVMAERAALDARIAAALEAAPTCDPARAGCRRQGGN